MLVVVQVLRKREHACLHSLSLVGYDVLDDQGPL